MACVLSEFPGERGDVPEARQAGFGWSRRRRGKPALTRRHVPSQQPVRAFPESGSWRGLHCWVASVNSIPALSLHLPVCVMVAVRLTLQVVKVRSSVSQAGFLHVDELKTE